MKSISMLVAWVGVMLGSAAAAPPDSTNGWGYGYDSLLRDLGEWRESPHVRIDSIGASVQGRALWMVSITEAGDSVGRGGDLPARKQRVFIHVRTHPSEVQAQYVANESIRYLLADTDASRALRRDFIFNFIPMYNPDGVELGKARTNARGVNLETNWDANPMEPESAALKSLFQAYMAGPTPVEVALNLHSDTVNCTRFFFFHYAAGTSEAYAELEKSFIGGVQARFPGGIRNWDFARSWPSGTVTYYPEGFWWLGYKEQVLALTYEDTNCPTASHFDSTGMALVLGSVDYLRARPAARLVAHSRSDMRLQVLREGIRVPSGRIESAWEVLDARGRRLAAGATPAEGGLIAWDRLPKAPVRIVTVKRAGQSAMSLILPLTP